VRELRRPSRWDWTYGFRIPLRHWGHPLVGAYYRRLVAYYVCRCRRWQRDCSRLMARIEMLERRADD
jgi:hypothetical protein